MDIGGNTLMCGSLDGLNLAMLLVPEVFDFPEMILPEINTDFSGMQQQVDETPPPSPDTDVEFPQFNFTNNVDIRR
jgi:hypothetical protein